MDLDRDNPLAAEIRQEIAEAYFAGCRKMVDSLEALKTFDRVVGSSTLDKRQIVRRSELLDEAGERVYFVVIQREAGQTHLKIGRNQPGKFCLVLLRHVFR
jgi:hypothetical protein